MELINNIRNFCITSHIDHGKSTLADRLLELTETISKEKMRPQYLDMMDLEREKGITIKMQPVRMEHQGFILNLIDTPGHVDFSYEVSRSLAAVEGAVLLVDATKGIQAQTLSNLELAKKQNLVIIPVVNKIDLSNTQIEKTAKEITNLLEINQNEIIGISAKYGTNVKELLEIIIKKIPPPKGNLETPLRALIFDSKYDPYKGVIAYVRVKDGKIKREEKIYLMATKTEAEAKETGFFKPELIESQELKAGEIGYIATGIKEPGKVRVGDTITKLTPKQSLRLATGQEIKNEKPAPYHPERKRGIDAGLKIEALPGYEEPKSMVFVSIYPENANDFEILKEALTELKLNDPSLTFNPEFKEGLGRGFLCGFLGSLHAEIITERLQREFNLNLVISSPSVVYKITTKKNEELLIKSVSDWPKDQSQIKEIREPWLKLEVITPLNFLGKVTEVIQSFEVKYKEKRYFEQDRALLIYEIPLREMVRGLYEKILGVSQGFASLNYEFLEFKVADLIKLDILIAGKKEESFSKIVPQNKDYQEGSKLVKKLKEVLPPQQFSVAIQAAVAGKIIARETIRARGKDVIAPLYGGDYTRKRKLLERQKKGKKELKEKSQIRIPISVFFEMLRK